MKNMKKSIMKILVFLWNFIEIYLPAVLLFFMFAVFILQIVMRYVFRSPLTWSFELTLFLYVYVVLLGSCYALRTGDHVEFSLVYDGMPSRVQSLMRIIGSMITIIIFGITFPNVVYYSWFIRVASMKVTTVLKIPYKYMYIVLLYMICSISVLLLIRAVFDIKELFKKDGNKGFSTAKSEGDNL